MSTKNTYRIHERLTTWATCDIEADSLTEALAIAGTYPDDVEWNYETDFDSGEITHGDFIQLNRIER